MIRVGFYPWIIFFDRINKINKIFFFSLYPEHPVYPVQKKNSYTIKLSA